MTRASDNPNNLYELLRQRTAVDPEKHFLYSEADGRKFSYQEFVAAVNRSARLLASKGIGKGDVVSLLMPNSAEYIFAYFACWKLGAIAGPVNSLLKAQEISYVISDSETKALLVHPEFMPAIDELKSNLPTLQAVIQFDDEAQAAQDFMDNGATETGEPADADATAIDCDSEAIIIYTSGTTGKPKGCLLTHGNLIANARQISEWFGIHSERSTAYDHAAVSYERSFGHDNVSALRRWVDSSQSKVFCLTFLANHFRLRNHLVWFSSNDVVDVA